MLRSDRLFGLAVMAGALAFFAGAFWIPSSFLSDPVGPRIFPMIVGIIGMACGLVMVIMPDGEPEWPTRNGMIGMAAAFVLMVGYAYGIGPLGFLLSTAVVAAGVSYLIEPYPVRALVTGVGLSLLLYAVFKYGLGLGLRPLPAFLAG